MSEQDLMEKALQSLQGCIKSEEITNVDRLHVALCGNTGTGKSYLVATTCRKPLLAYDFDNRRESIAGIKDVVIKTLVDIKDDDPKAWSELESDFGTLEYLKSKGELPFKSILLDSCTFLRQYAEHQFFKDSNMTGVAKFKIGVSNYYVPRGWDSSTAVGKMLDGILNRAFSLDVDVYMTFHTRQEKDNVRSTKDNPVYKDTLTIDPPQLKALLPKFNDKWRTYVDSDGSFKVQLRADFNFAAATVLKGVGQTENADIQEFLRKHKDGK